MIQYTYKITDLKTYSIDTLENVVKKASIKIIGSLNGKTHENFFEIELDNPDFNSFIDYKNLTEEQVINWVIQKYGVEQFEAIKFGIKSWLEQDLGNNVPLHHTSLPWK